MSAQDTAGFGVVPRYLRGRLTPQEMAVYVVLSWRANEAGECWPSLATLAADACCSKSTVQRALEGLREKKAVRWERRTAGDGALTSSVYRLAIWRDPQVIGTTPNGQKDHTLWSERPDPIVDMTIPYSRFDHVTRTIEREPLNDKQSPSTAAPLTTRDATIEPVSPPMSTEPIQPGNEQRPDPIANTITDPPTPPASRPAPRAPRHTTPTSPAFDEFWATYPRRVGKAAAWKAWVAALRRARTTSGRQDLSAVIVAAAHRIANDPNLPEPQFIPHPATWLDRAGWEDAPYPDRHTGKLATTDQRVLDGAAIVARLQAIERGELTNTSPFQIGASHDTI